MPGITKATPDDLESARYESKKEVTPGPGDNNDDFASPLKWLFERELSQVAVLSVGGEGVEGLRQAGCGRDIRHIVHMDLFRSAMVDS